MFLEINHLYFSYNPENELFVDFNLQIEKGKIVAIAGESGCGKSTLLSLIYGLIDWQGGEIWFNGEQCWGPKGNIVPGESEMKFVAQNYDLMPYSTVYDNVGKYLSNIDLATKRSQVMRLLNIVGMENYADVKPKFLSGGQQQRVAIARALSVIPKLLLLDEPFSNLDYSRKVQLRENLFSFVKEHNIPLLISTHDIQEIMPWIDELIILQKGKMVQRGKPIDIYKSPDNEYVARLLGEVNILSDDEKDWFQLKRKFWFPHQIQISEDGQPAMVFESRFAGNHYWNKIEIDGINFVMYTSMPISGIIKISFCEE